jgi:hypothetical protein
MSLCAAHVRFEPKADAHLLLGQSGRCPIAALRPSQSGGWNHHLQRKLPQRSRQQLRPPQPGPAPQAPHPGPHPGPPHPGPPPRQRKLPQRSRQQRRPHCTSVILSRPAFAAAGSGKIGAAWVVPEPPAKTRPVIPIANSMRNICVHPIFPWLTRSSTSLERRATDQLNTGPAVP